MADGCPICLDSIGHASIKLTPCRHTFCRACVETYVEIELKQRHFPIRCPVSGCGSTLCRTELDRLVGAELLATLVQVLCEHASVVFDMCLPSSQTIFACS